LCGTKNKPRSGSNVGGLEVRAAVIVGRHFSGCQCCRDDRPPSAPISFAQFDPSMNVLATSSFQIRVERIKKPVSIRDHDHFSESAANF